MPTLRAISGVMGQVFAVPRMPSVPKNLRAMSFVRAFQSCAALGASLLSAARMINGR